MTEKKFNWPRIRDLEESERQTFLDFLAKGNFCSPHLEGVLPEDQDGYYEADYLNFKGIPPTPYFE